MNSYNPKIEHEFDPITNDWINPYKDIDWDLLFKEACKRYPIGCLFKTLFDDTINEVLSHKKDKKYWKVHTFWYDYKANTINLKVIHKGKSKFATVWCNGDWAEKYMNAKEARIIAESNNNILNDSQYIKILEQIKDAVNKGKFIIDVDLPNEKVRNILESDGYTIDIMQSGINEYCLRITW